ncbi:MAG: N-acetyl-alpha-D-glucosaminyl L-malate synthase [Elusimicrobia bacterium]|nr:N-acetyl-alpha-D-glucosaminyl L-malate synthase [Elusimicrobiota bacterium]
MEALRIAHIDTERSWRGGEQQVLSLMEGLKARGHLNVLVSRKGSPLSERAREVAEIMEVHPWGEWDFVTAHFVNQRIKKQNIQVLHAHTGHGVSLAVLSRLGTRIPIVATRRVDFPVGQNLFSRWKYSQLNHMVAISKGVQKVLIESDVPERKITVVPSGVDFKRYERVQPFTKDKLGVPESHFLIGQVAALAPHKDQNNFLEALAIFRKEVPSFKAIIVGEGELKPQLERKIRSLGLENHIQLLGFKENPLDYLAAFDVFCLSSKEEGLGTSILDAMALHVPVVATAVGGIPELVEPGITGYLAKPQDPAALAESLLLAYKAGPKTQEIVENAAKKVKKFDILETITKMERIYTQLSTALST